MTTPTASQPIRRRPGNHEDCARPGTELPDGRASGELPEGLRLWIARTDAQRGDVEMFQRSQHLLPVGSNATFVSLGTHIHGELLLCLGWQIPDRLPHPMARMRLALELWPQVPASLSLADLPLLSATGRDQFVRGFLFGNTTAAVEAYEDSSSNHPPRRRHRTIHNNRTPTPTRPPTTPRTSHMSTRPQPSNHRRHHQPRQIKWQNCRSRNNF